VEVLDRDDLMAQRTRRGTTIPRLRAWREHAALSQVELAARSGLSRPTITRAETGEHVVEWPNIRKIAAALEVTVKQLLEEKPQ
jgi:transcriptional regulator with XRE-family HTH domain